MHAGDLDARRRGLQKVDFSGLQVGQAQGTSVRVYAQGPPSDLSFGWLPAER